ncbi:type II toxin-antitoxin system RelE/ParE family toxin [Microvirga sp. KLBC 81]|uniref:type II toxin-antitoxin system RelE/ParE family toxin n=1 Tax=Microvirga sp. KLBC 81 TaxID=1862707 RepID=UPI001FDF7A06|nr:type II toxin-antitoxin system RelE/ParE family toxin [Microvirga sp. KLBC 81]
MSYSSFTIGGIGLAINLPTAQKPVEWIGSSLDELKELPEEVRREVGHAIFTAQIGGKHPSAKPLTGDKAFKGAGVLEVVEDHDGNTYRAVYTVRFEGVVYILHAFQKKSKKGIATPKEEVDRIKRRLAAAMAHYEENYRARNAG